MDWMSPRERKSALKELLKGLCVERSDFQEDALAGP